MDGAGRIDEIGPMSPGETIPLDRRGLALYPALLLAAWTIAWLIDLALRNAFGWGDGADTAYWIAMKVALWVVPVIMLLRLKRIPVATFVELVIPAKGLGIGALAGLGVLAFSFGMDAVLGSASFNIPVLGAAHVNGLLVAPWVEEFTMRGFYLTSLERAGTPFMQANARAGVVFVALHLPGWYFQGRLRSPLSLLQPAIFLWLLALLLGWIKKTSGSLYAPMVVHILNNVYAAARG